MMKYVVRWNILRTVKFSLLFTVSTVVEYLSWAIMHFSINKFKIWVKLIKEGLDLAMNAAQAFSNY